ncbi:hypothetical protein vBAcoSR7M_4 [Alteromonas phage vB_AcoS-R7M]|uniref:Uncharacterized protein n=1 Tax=Alteromonas phage vB_AcoS-R7M TaxID=2729541 RepID=A0A6M3YTC1_9CAUD|nr:hypothetical protein HWD34_gp04 [Alteromonas phage vB_AcoS-R7M]QJI53326.1 hypothetical protein vBAcoSR7M_4 [Alteromonas phage vB_AcoS-R7M]
MGRPSDVRRQARFDYDGTDNAWDMARKRYPNKQWEQGHYIQEWNYQLRADEAERKRRIEEASEAEYLLQGISEILRCEKIHADRFIRAFDFMCKKRGLL